MSTIGTSAAEFDRKWLSELAASTELECMSILYAKSLLDPAEEVPEQSFGAQRIYVGISGEAKGRKSSEPPVKPQRFIARMTSAEKSYVMTANSFRNPNRESDCEESSKLEKKLSTLSRSTANDGTNKNQPKTSAAASAIQSVSQCTQTEEKFLQNQEDDFLRTDFRHSASTERNSSRLKDCCLQTPSPRYSLIRRSNGALNVEIASEISDYEKLPIVPQVEEETLYDVQFGSISSARSSQRFSTAGRAAVAHRTRSQRTVSEQNNNFTFAQPHQRTVCSECGKRSSSQLSQMSRSMQLESSLTLRGPSPFVEFNASAPGSAVKQAYSSNPAMSQSWNEFSVNREALKPSSRCCRWNALHPPPQYSQLRVMQRGNRMTSQVMVNNTQQSHATVLRKPKVYSEVIRHRYPPFSGLEPSTSGTLSTKSVDSLSNSSVDSGQESGELSSQGHSSKDFLEASYEVTSQKGWPSYARMANSMDQVLRMSTSLYSLLNLPADKNSSRDLLAKTNILLHIMEASPSASFLPAEEIVATKQIMQDLQAECNRTGRPIIVTSCFSNVLRKLLKEILLLFTKILSRYLLECTNKDRLLVIALEHLIHIMLFGEDMRLEAIRFGGLKAIYSFCQTQTTPSDTMRLLLRALAVMCNASQGSQRIIALGGLEMITQILCTSSVACGVEAAGVLTQLTNPNRGLIKLHPSIDNIVARLLDVIDACDTGESLLLCVAAIANVSVQSQNVINILYQHNAVKRLIAALNRPKCSTIFVQEQIVNIFSRMAMKGYEEALIAQGAIPVLFSMLTVFDPLFMEYSRRIQYKAAVCIGTVSSKGVGLKAIYQNNGYPTISKVLQTEGVPQSPIGRICSTIKEKLERKYELESAV